eukprot:2168169-Amphidinium_carterae.2
MSIWTIGAPRPLQFQRRCHSESQPLPRASSKGSIESDSTIDRDQIDLVERMMWTILSSPQCSPF